MGSNSTESYPGQSGANALSTYDRTEENLQLKTSCVLDLNKAELPIIFIFTLAVNLLALAVLLRMRGSCDTLDHLLVSILNINDILTTGIFVFMWLTGWASCDAVLVKPMFCGLFGWVGTSLVVWSAFIIVIMTSLRFLSLVKPLYYRAEITTNTVIKASVGTLVFCLVFFLAPFTGYTAPYRVYEDNHICAVDFAPGEKGLLQRSFIGATGVIGCLTVAHVALCNSIIMRTLRKRNAIHIQPETVVSSSHNNTRSGYQGKRRIFGHVTLVVSLVYALCYAPFVIRLLVDTVTDLDHQNNPVHSVTMSLLFLSPLLNPIIYGVFNRHFRRNLFELLRAAFSRCSPLGQRQELTGSERRTRHEGLDSVGIETQIHVVSSASSTYQLNKTPVYGPRGVQMLTPTSNTM